MGQAQAQIKSALHIEGKKGGKKERTSGCAGMSIN